MTDILDLPGWKVLSSDVVGGEYVIEGAFEKVEDACVKCGVVGGLYRHGPKDVTYRDSPIRGYPSKLVAKVQRYKCRECGSTFLQTLDGVDSQRRMTNRCREYIEQQSLRDTFSHVAEHVGCDEKTIRNIAREHIQWLDSLYQRHAPDWLGIDEVHVSGKLRCVLTDVGNRRPVDILSDRGRNMVGHWLQTLPNRDEIQGVTMDMWRPYRDLVRQILPDAAIVVDKFHVVAMVNRSLDRVRKGLRGNQTAGERRKLMRSRHMLMKRPVNLNDKQSLALDGWLKNVPELAAAYHLKESFFDIYGMGMDDATLAIREWPKTIPDNLAHHFREITTALGNWEPEILAYFTHPYTNAYTEALNGVTKVVNRQGRGYTFEVLRARVLFRDFTPAQEIEKVGPVVLEQTTKYIQETGLLRSFLLSKHQGHCQSCNGLFEQGEMEVHIKPISTTVMPDNALLLCHSCHSRIHSESAS